MKPVTAILGEPMGAPEDRTLKALRVAILMACSVVAFVMVAFAGLRVAFGIAPSVVVLLALITLVTIVPFYVRLKNERDAEHLDELVAAARAKRADAGDSEC